VLRARPQDDLDKRLAAAAKTSFRARVFDPLALPKPGERVRPSAVVKRGRTGPPVTVRYAIVAAEVCCVRHLLHCSRACTIETLRIWSSALIIAGYFLVAASCMFQ
jgi:hypothetical protein